MGAGGPPAPPTAAAAASSSAIVATSLGKNATSPCLSDHHQPPHHFNNPRLIDSEPLPPPISRPKRDPTINRGTETPYGPTKLRFRRIPFGSLKRPIHLEV